MATTGRITAQAIKAMTAPARGNTVHWDSETTGLGARITAAGKVAFVLRYVINGRERRMTLGGWPELTVSAAREMALRLKGEIARGVDPLERRESDRTAPDVRQLCKDYLTRHAERHKRAGSIRDDRSMIEREILPGIGRRRVLDVTRRDIEDIHAKLKSTPYRANRVLALLSKMFAMAVRWGWRSDNPVIGIDRYPEEKRDRWLSTDEMARLAAGLDAYGDQRVANAIRLLLLTGARKSEVLNLEWDHLDFARGVWSKPSSHTKQKRAEHVPLSAPAIALLSEIRAEADRLAEELGEAYTPSPFVFPGDKEGRPLQDIKKGWKSICKAAGIENARLHDLRHTFASHLVSGGLALPIVGRLLGHTQPQTTARYAHLADDPLREAAGRIGALYDAARGARTSAEVMPLKGPLKGAM
ncbi:MAG: integrase [Rhodospirillaceae bacterium]|nr:integrase [Rhodospirillaceae bacterium]